MPYSDRMQRSHLYTVFFAPRGMPRMADLGMQIAQQYLSPFDKLIGLIGEAGSGKSMLIKGMFPGLELTNDDEGVNVRPLPILKAAEDSSGFFSAHTYHLDIRFEMAFTDVRVLAEAIQTAIGLGKRVIVEHFELVYPYLDRNAHLIIGIGEELIITRPTLFGPEPQDIANIVFKSIPFRRMTHTAEDLCEYFLKQWGIQENYVHADVRHGFVLKFIDKPNIDIYLLEQSVNQMIDEDVPVSYLDDHHILIGQEPHECTGPRMHVSSTKEIRKLTLTKELLLEPITNHYLLVGVVGEYGQQRISDLNKI